VDAPPPERHTLILNDILDRQAIQTFFHPIIRSKDHSIIGYEALSRGPVDSLLESPAALFAAAAHAGKTIETDLLCQRLAIRNFVRLNLPGKLFINLLGETLAHAPFAQDHLDRVLNETGLPASRVVLELTEHRPLPVYEKIIRALHECRRRGYMIALDNIGGGHNGLLLWHATLPDFIKIDRHFIHGLGRDPSRRKFVSGLTELSHRIDCQIIAKGVEGKDEHEWLEAFGIPLLQGYLFGTPMASPPRAMDTHRPRTSPALGPSTAATGHRLDGLIRVFPTIAPQKTVEQVGQRFLANPGLRYLPVVHDGRPVGMVWRTRFMDMYVRPFSSELYGRKAILAFVDTAFKGVDADLSIETLGQLATQDPYAGIDEAFIITRNGLYAGMVELKDLLRALTDMQMRNALHANPLTGLPGNTPINETMREWLRLKQSFVACYIDLDQFKAYNDVYGYQKGDEAIDLVARLLREHTAPGRDFIGHIGGDDFMALFQSPAWETCAQALLGDFESEVKAFYSEEHQRLGDILTQDRHGAERLIPMMSLSIGAVPCTPDRFASHHEIGTRLIEVKKMAKGIQGNSLFIERRGMDGEIGEASMAPPPTRRASLHSQ